MPRVAVAQFSGNVDWRENIAAVRRLALRAAEAGAGFVCFPELASTIYPAFTNDPELFRLAEPEDGPSVTAARAIAREAGLVLVYPFFEREGDHYYNSAVVFSGDGQRLTKYRKNTIPSGLGRLVGTGGSEEYYFRPGDLGFPVVQTELGYKLGLNICYDRNLPEPARCAALNGAELLCVPVTSTQRARSRWEMLLCARAVENVMYVAAPNRVGVDQGGAPGEFYFGESLIINPRGEIVAHASATEEDVVWADLDRDLLERQRKNWVFFTDRRPDQYAAIRR
jgi:predicted amidohydrolase